MDSRFHGNDEIGGWPAASELRTSAGATFSPRPPLRWIPAFAGMTNWPAGCCRGRGQALALRAFVRIVGGGDGELELLYYRVS